MTAASLILNCRGSIMSSGTNAPRCHTNWSASRACPLGLGRGVSPGIPRRSVSRFSTANAGAAAEAHRRCDAANERIDRSFMRDRRDREAVVTRFLEQRDDGRGRILVFGLRATALAVLRSQPNKCTPCLRGDPRMERTRR